MLVHVEHVLAAMQPLLTQLLNLPGMDVEDYQDRGHEMILKVEGRRAYASCPRCRQESQNLHQNHRHQVRDLSISQRQVFLNLNRRQFKCRLTGNPLVKNLTLSASAENIPTDLQR